MTEDFDVERFKAEIEGVPTLEDELDELFGGYDPRVELGGVMDVIREYRALWEKTRAELYVAHKHNDDAGRERLISRANAIKQNVEVLKEREEELRAEIKAKGG